jgi:hypothetical protein
MVERVVLGLPIPASREDLGLPSKWSVVMFWLFASSPATATTEPIRTEGLLKNPNIPELVKYGGQGSPEFWKQFPFNGLPTRPETKIITANLRTIKLENSTKLLKSELDRAMRSLEYLEIGGPTFQKGPIGSCIVKKFKKVPGTRYGSNRHHSILDIKEIRGRPIYQSSTTKAEGQLHPSGTPTNEFAHLHQRITARRVKLQR